MLFMLNINIHMMLLVFFFHFDHQFVVVLFLRRINHDEEYLINYINIQKVNLFILSYFIPKRRTTTTAMMIISWSLFRGNFYYFLRCLNTLMSFWLSVNYIKHVHTFLRLASKGKQNTQKNIYINNIIIIIIIIKVKWICHQSHSSQFAQQDIVLWVYSV